MEQNELIMDYLRSLFEDETDKDIVALLWDFVDEDIDDVLDDILSLMERTK